MSKDDCKILKYNKNVEKLHRFINRKIFPHSPVNLIYLLVFKNRKTLLILKFKLSHNRNSSSNENTRIDCCYKFVSMETFFK